MEHLTFWQSVLIALSHQIVAILAVIGSTAIAYLKIKNRQNAHREEIIVMLNGALEQKIKAAVQEQRDSIGE